MTPKTTTFVSPADGLGHSDEFRLAPVDHVMPQVYTRSLLCYRYTPSWSVTLPFEGVVNLLQSSLSSVLSEYPILTGRLFTEPATGKPWVRSTTETGAKSPQSFGVRFVVNDLVDSTFPSFSDLERQNFPISLLPGDILAPVESSPIKLCKDTIDQTESGVELLAIQINLISGGIILTVCSHHLICDGTGHASFIQRWAELSRKILRDPGELVSTYNPSIHDRSPLMPDHDSWITVPQQEHKAYKVVEPVKTPPLQGFKLPPMESVIFHIKPENIQLLKAQCNSTDPKTMRLSTNDAFSALFWRVVSRARLEVKGTPVDDQTMSMLGMAVNARSRLIPPLPKNYFGNVNIYSVTLLPLSVLASPLTPLSTVALSIRGSVETIDSDFVRSAVQYLHTTQQDSSVIASFNCFLGNDLAITSWADMALYGEGGDFGFGELEWARVPNAQFDGIGIVLPRKDGPDEGLEFLVGLEANCMKRMKDDDEWKTYFDVRAL